MGTIQTNITPQFNYQLMYAGVPLLIDVAKIVRINFGDDNEIKSSKDQHVANTQAPRKHQPLADIVDELNRLIPFDRLDDFNTFPNYVGRNLGAIARKNLGHNPNPSAKIGEWYYPNSASRWSVFRGLATGSQVDGMLANTNGGALPATFIMQAPPVGAAVGDASFYTLQTFMYMLPPRLLAEHGGQFDGLYLITLVDERYHWQYTPISLGGSQTNTWGNLLELLSTALGVQLGLFTPLQPAYSQPEPDSQFWTNFESAPLLLDAIAYNVGRTVVRDLAGFYSLQSPTDAATIVYNNRGNAAQVLRTAGGDMMQLPQQPGQGPSIVGNAVLPDSVNVAFPYYVMGDDPVPHFLNPRYQDPVQRPSCWYEESYGQVYDLNVPYQYFADNQLLPAYTGVPGRAYTVRTTAKALISGEIQTTPINASGLASMARQLAFDYYSWQLGFAVITTSGGDIIPVQSALDEVYPGTFLWTTEGLHDIVWTYSARSKQATTRVKKAPWNAMATEMQHAAHALPGKSIIPRGVGGPSVALNIRDSQQNVFNGLVLSGQPTPPPPINTPLAADLNVGDQSVLVNKVDFFPTQNRWRGSIDNEVLIFEGTSGGILGGSSVSTSGSPPTALPFRIDIAKRPDNGTLEAKHSGGAILSQICPNTGYGVNLITAEKMQFFYPHEWTHGIQGVRIVPQTQTVFVFDGSGAIFADNLTYYSGQVMTYDATQGSQPWIQAEFVWVRERNSNAVNSGTQYDGQLVFPGSISGSAPIYAIDGAGTSVPMSGTSGGLSTFPPPIYDNASLTIIPPPYPVSVRTSPPPYSSGIIAQLKNVYGFDFVDVGTDIQGSHALEAGQPQWWCHKTATNTYCSNDRLPQPGDIRDPIGPFPSQQDCLNTCNAAPIQTSPNPTCVVGTSGIEPPLSWWCHTTMAGTSYCSADSNPQPGDSSVTGPFMTQDACLAACSTGPKEKWWCHQTSAVSYCSQDSTPQPGDIMNPTGPFPDLNSCNSICLSPNRIEPTYWNKQYSTGQGDTGKDTTVRLKSTTLSRIHPTYINSSPPGGSSNSGGQLNPLTLNIINSCTVTWGSYFDPSCNTLDAIAEWNGIAVQGSFGQTSLTSCTGSCPPLSKPAISGTNHGVDSLLFDPCDFETSVVDGVCKPRLKGVQIKTQGASATIQYLDANCAVHSLCFKDGLFRGTT